MTKKAEATEATEAKPKKAQLTNEGRVAFWEAKAQKARDAKEAADQKQAAAQEATACKSLRGSITGILIGQFDSKALAALLWEIELHRTALVERYEMHLEELNPAPSFTSIAGIAPPEPGE